MIYVLKLEQGKYYVGKSNDIKARIQAHKEGRGSAFTMLYKFKETIDLIQDYDFLELAITLKYMKKYGIDNVRGSTYSQVKLSKDQKKEIEAHFRGEDNVCFKCGKTGHFIRDCVYKEQKSCMYRVLLYIKSFLFWGSNPEQILLFGKYRGYSYDYVYENDKDYCNWILENNNGKLPGSDRFKNWLLEKSKLD